MKKYLGLLVVLLVAFNISANVGQAEDNSSNGVEVKAKVGENRLQMKAGIETRRGEFKQKFEDLRNKIKDERDTAKARIKETRLSVRENALQRFDAVVERINNLLERVNDHIAKLEARGVSVADAKGFMATAEIKLDLAGEKIAEINALLSVSINELSAGDKTKLRTLANDTQSLIKEAHEALRSAVKSLKDALRAQREAEASNSGEDN